MEMSPEGHKGDRGKLLKNSSAGMEILTDCGTL